MRWSSESFCRSSDLSPKIAESNTEGMRKFRKRNILLGQNFTDVGEGFLNQVADYVRNIGIVGIKGSSYDLGAVDHIGNGDFIQRFFQKQIGKGFFNQSRKRIALRYSAFAI